MFLSSYSYDHQDDNGLSGSIPNELSDLKTLRHLILKKNVLGGTLPTSLSLLTNLEVVLLEQNLFTGDADVLCNRQDKINTFVADCGGKNVGGTGGGENDDDLKNGTVSNDGSYTGIECADDCCSLCCNVGDATCNEFDWKGNLDPIWEYGYRRRRYSYDLGPNVWLP